MHLHSQVDEVRSQRGVWGTTSQPTLAITYGLKPQPAERMPTAQNNGATIAISAAGGAGGHLLITLTENKVDQTGTATTAVTTTINGDDYPTLKAIIDKINSIGNSTNPNTDTRNQHSSGNFKAWALHAPLSYATNVATFATLATTAIPTGTGGSSPLKCLYRTMSSGSTLYMRVGIPEARDEGFIRGLKLWGTNTCTAAGGTVKVYRDSYPAYDGTTTTQSQYLSKVTVNALTEYLGESGNPLTKLNAIDMHGPIIVEVAASDLTVADFTLTYMAGTV